MSEDEQKNETTEEPQGEGPGAAPDQSPAFSRWGRGGELHAGCRAGGWSLLLRPPAGEEEPASEATAAEPEPAEEPAGAEPRPAAEPSPEDDLPWKERQRLERSRRPHQAGPQLSAEQRAAKRAEARKANAELRRKQRAAAKARQRGCQGPGRRLPSGAPMRRRSARGSSSPTRVEKSIVVRIDIARRHPTYEKVVRRSRTLHAHDERNEAGEGDVVRVVETRPLSKTKRWRLVEVVEKAK